MCVQSFSRSLKRLHYPHLESYSVQRLFALDDYCTQTPSWRAIAVCLLFPLPAFVISVGMELIPLQNPCDGAHSNTGAWVRLFILHIITSAAQIVQLHRLVPQLVLSALAIVRLSLCTAFCYVFVTFVTSMYWTFPVPLGLAIGTMPFSIFQTVFFLLTVGISRLRASASLRQQIAKPLKIMVAQGTMLAIFILFSALYQHIPSTSRPFLVVLLPVIKLFTQHDVVRTTKDLEDNQPVLVVFCVEGFNAIYSVMSMEGAGDSMFLTSLVIVAFDSLEFMIVTRGLRSRMTHIRQTHLKLVLSETSYQASPLLETIMSLCQQPNVLSVEPEVEIPRIRIHSTVHYPFSPETRLKVERIFRNSRPQPQFNPRSFHCDTNTLPRQVLPVSPRPILIQGLMPITHKTPSKETRIKPEVMTTREKHDLVQSALRVLFECEYHLLVEYIECFIPLIFAIYFTILCRLPSAAYYPATRDLTTSEAEAITLNLVAFAGLEMISFLLMSVVVWRECGFRPIFMLAFVLETQVLECQGQLLVWYISLLQFTLKHFGESSMRLILILLYSNPTL